MSERPQIDLAEANAVVAEARAWQRRFTNEELEQFWAPPEWGVLYEPPPPRKISPAIELAVRILRAKRARR